MNSNFNIPLEVGKTYRVNSQRKGKFEMKVTSVSGEWATGIITKDRATAMLADNEREVGEEVTVRDTLTHFAAL